MNRDSRSSARKESPGHSVPRVRWDRPGQLAFRAPLVHREIHARTDKMDKMASKGPLEPQDLEARMA